jgi:hypothetical protein
MRRSFWVPQPYFDPTERWNVVKIHKAIWDALLDYGKVAWNKCMRLIRKNPRARKKKKKKTSRKV